MECPHCHEENSYKANYCHYCGEPFTKAQREDAWSKTFFGKVEKVTSFLTLSFIKDAKPVKIGAIVVFVLFGAYNYMHSPKQLYIQDTPYYHMQYDKVHDQYYMEVANQEEVTLDLHLKQEANDITITSSLGTETFLPDDNITLKIPEDGQFTLSATFKKNTEALNVIVYQGGANHE